MVDLKELRVPSSVQRLQYFFGQLLTQRDLAAEQAYHVTTRRLMQRETFGTGTIAGLRVEAAKQPRSVIVKPGLALDPDGRELLLEKEVCLEVTDAPLPGLEASYLDDLTANPQAGSVAGAVRQHWQEAFGENDVSELSQALGALGLSEFTDNGSSFGHLVAQLQRLGDRPADFALQPGQRLVDYLFGRFVGQTHIGLRYQEQGADPAPALLDGTCCGESGCFATRATQGVSIVTSPTPFPALPSPFLDAQMALEHGLLDLQNPVGTNVASPPLMEVFAQHLLDSWRGLPSPAGPCPPMELPIVPLACVSWRRLAVEAAPQIVLIEQIRCRPLAPGSVKVWALVEALLQGQSPFTLAPRFDLMQPTHRAQLSFGPEPNTAHVRVRSTSRLVASGPGWQVDVYRHLGESPVQLTANAATLDNMTVEQVLAVENGRTFVELVFTGNPLEMPSGTYVWRINHGNVLRASQEPALLDGEPRFPMLSNHPALVPSGDGTQGGEFAAIFFVP